MTEEKRPRRQSQRLGESRSRNTRLPKKTSPVKQQTSGDWFWVSLGAGIVMMVGVLIFLLLPGDETPAIPETAVAPEPTAAESVEAIPDPAASGYSERAVADWILSNGGRVRVLESNRPVYEVYDKTALPSGDFKLQAVSLDGIEAATDARVGDLWGLQTLAELGLSGTKITDEGVKTLPKLKSLNTVNLRGCPITDQGLSTLGSMSNLKLLIADGGLPPMSTVREAGMTVTPDGQTTVSFTDEGLESLSGLKNLQTLSLVSSKASDSGLAAIAKSAKKLVQLRTVGFGITNGGVAVLKPLTNLRVLELSNSLIDDDCIDTLSQLKWLDCLVVQGTRITPAGVKRLQQKLPKCKVFGGKFDPRLNVIREIYVLGGTVSISIDGQPPLQVKSFADLPEGPFVVQRVDLTNSKRVFLADLPLPEVKELVLSGSELQPGDTFKIHESFPALTQLDLSKTLADDSVIESLSKLRALQSIDVQRARFTANGLVDLRVRLLEGCDVLDGEEYDKTQDRRVAEAIVGLGQNAFVVEPGAKFTQCYTLADIPSGPFKIRDFHLGALPEVNDAWLAQLVGLRGLRSVSTWNCNLSDGAMATLVKIPTLQSIHLCWQKPFSDAGMVPLTNLRHLSFFGIEGASQIGLEGLQRLGASPSLTNLTISSEKIDDAAMKLIADQYPNLTGATLWNSTMTDNGVSDLLRLKKLQYLDLGGATQFTSMGVNRILDLPDLWNLRLSTPVLTPEVLLKLFRHPKIRNISLGSERLDESSFAPLLNTEGRSGQLDVGPDAMSFKLAKQIRQRHPNFRINRGDIVRRDIVHWVLDAGGTMTLTVKGNSRPVTLKKGDPLPEEDFEAIKGDVTGLPGGRRLLNSHEVNGPGLLELEEAILTDTDTPGNILMGIGGFQRLTKLDVSGIKVTDVHIDRMPVMPNLKTLDLRRTEITAEGALRLAARMPHLKIGVDDAIQEKIKQLQGEKQ